jgi:hypothetical protein
MAKENVIYTTWSPECFLEVAIFSYPMFMKHHTPLFLYENFYDLEFKVTLGDIQYYGCSCQMKKYILYASCMTWKVVFYIR